MRVLLLLSLLPAWAPLVSAGPAPLKLAVRSLRPQTTGASPLQNLVPPRSAAPLATALPSLSPSAIPPPDAAASHAPPAAAESPAAFAELFPALAAADPGTDASDPKAEQAAAALFDGLGDYPPAGPVALTPERAEQLRADLVASPQPIMSPEGFSWLVENAPDVTRLYHTDMTDGVDVLPDVVLLMKDAIAHYVWSDRRAPERAATAALLSQRFTAALKAVSADAAIPKKVRALAEHALRHYFGGAQIVGDLMLLRQAYQRLTGLQPPDQAPASDSADLTHEAAPARWTIPEPTPADMRGARLSESFREERDLRKLDQMIAETHFNAEQADRRARLAASGRFSDSLSRKTAATAADFRARIVPQWSPSIFGLLNRFSSVHDRSLLTPRHKRRRVDRIPKNKNLRLIPQPGGFRVDAVFQTNIRDRRVLAAVKASIEDYWRGRFTLNGRSLSFRANVKFEELPPEQAFDPDALHLVASDIALSAVSGNTIHLQRDFTYETPAHEFGHILGLPDDYHERFDPVSRRIEYIGYPGNIMGSLRGGVLLERHFKTAYLLLRRHSRVSGNS